MSKKKSQIQVAIEYLNSLNFKIYRVGWGYSIDGRKIVYGHNDIKWFAAALQNTPELIAPCLDGRLTFWWHHFDYKRVSFFLNNEYSLEQIMNFIDLYREVENTNDNKIERDRAGYYIEDLFWTCPRKGWNLNCDMKSGSIRYFMNGECLMKVATHNNTWYQAKEHKFKKFKSLAQLEKLNMFI